MSLHGPMATTTASDGLPDTPKAIYVENGMDWPSIPADSIGLVYHCNTARVPGWTHGHDDRSSSVSVDYHGPRDVIDHGRELFFRGGGDRAGLDENMRFAEPSHSKVTANIQWAHPIGVSHMHGPGPP